MLDVMEPDNCYLWWTITLRTPADENAIRDVFIFVEDDSKLEIEEIESAPRASAGEPARNEICLLYTSRCV